MAQSNGTVDTSKMSADQKEQLLRELVGEEGYKALVEARQKELDKETRKHVKSVARALCGLSSDRKDVMPNKELSERYAEAKAALDSILFDEAFEIARRHVVEGEALPEMYEDEEEEEAEETTA